MFCALVDWPPGHFAGVPRQASNGRVTARGAKCRASTGRSEMPGKCRAGRVLVWLPRAVLDDIRAAEFNFHVRPPLRVLMRSTMELMRFSSNLAI